MQVRCVASKRKCRRKKSISLSGGRQGGAGTRNNVIHCPVRNSIISVVIAQSILPQPPFT